MDPITITAVSAIVASLGALVKPLVDVIWKYVRWGSKSKVRISITDADGNVKSLEYGGSEGDVTEDQIKKLIALLEEANDGAKSISSKK